MLAGSDRSYSRRDTILFLACLALSVTALFAPVRFAHGIATFLRESVLAPLVWLQERAEEGRTSRARKLKFPGVEMIESKSEKFVPSNE